MVAAARARTAEAVVGVGLLRVFPDNNVVTPADAVAVDAGCAYMAAVATEG